MNIEADQEVIVEQREDESQAAAEAFYWGTLHDMFTLMLVYGQEQVLADFQKVANSVGGEQPNPAIIIPE